MTAAPKVTQHEHRHPPDERSRACRRTRPGRVRLQARERSSGGCRCSCWVTLGAAIMDQLDLARIQFATTSIYHFFFVPVTMGLAILVAVLHTRWHRSGDPELRRLTRFFGTLMLISISVGVVTGLVQEFQFGMDWSAYSRFVGDVFGAPLAMEGLAAFFLESTFLGLWLFGWNVLPKRVHLFTVWMIPVGAFLSALFIIAANSWMQNPRGYTIDPATGRAQLTSCLLYTSPSPRDRTRSRMPSSA